MDSLRLWPSRKNHLVDSTEGRPAQFKKHSAPPHPILQSRKYACSVLVQSKVLAASRWFVSCHAQLLIHASLLRLEILNKTCNNTSWVNKKEQVVNSQDQSSHAYTRAVCSRSPSRQAHTPPVGWVKQALPSSFPARFGHSPALAPVSQVEPSYNVLLRHRLPPELEIE